MFLSSVCFAQKTVQGRVHNSFTKEGVPFAGVYWKLDKFGTTTDSSGHFSLHKSNHAIDTLVVTYVGYTEVYKPVNMAQSDGEIIIHLAEAKLQEGPVVKAKFSKGLRWWKNVMTNKAKNNPYQFNNYAYELYNKLELDLNNIQEKTFQQHKLLKPFGFIAQNIDTVSEQKPFLPVFLTESLSDYYYSNQPYKVREVIKAAQTNGVKNETVLQFIGGINQKVNLYQDYVVLFGKEFISPFHSNATKFYHYKGADTQIVAGEKFFHLLFTPKNTGENTFSGDCWVHSTTWALQRIEVRISATANINFVNRLSIVQEYKWQNGRWIFAKDKIIADLSPFKKDKFSFIGRKTSTYQNVVINEPKTTEALAKNKQQEEVIVLEDATDKGKAFWASHRHEQLSGNEAKVIWMIDTLKQMPIVKKYTRAIAFVFDGHKKFGAIEIGPWFKWVSGNQHERIRTRFDLGTTEQFSKKLRLSGYLAYGFADAQMKGKFEASYKFKKGFSVTASYMNDLDNGRARSADEDATTDNMFSQIIRRANIKQKFVGVDETKLSITKTWSNHLSITTTFKRVNYDLYQPLPQKKFLSYRDDDVVNTELGIRFRYAPGELALEGHRKTRRLKKHTAPEIQLYVAKGLPDVWQSQYSYVKTQLSYQQKIKIHRFGEIQYNVYGGKIWGDKIPFMVLEVHPGNEIYYYSKNSFNLMNRFEYVSDQYYGLNIEHNFEKKLLNLLPFMRKTKMRQFWNVKTVRGSVTRTNALFNRCEFGGYHLRQLNDKYYTEVGTGFDNIFKFFRIDAVWRFAPPTPFVNSPILNTTKQSFGIFGSFRLQF